MKEFIHVSASSIDHAVSVLQEYGQEAHLMAGGQDILFRIKKYLVQPACIVDLKTIPGLNCIKADTESNVKIGSLVTLAKLAVAPEIQNDSTRYWQRLQQP